MAQWAVCRWFLAKLILTLPQLAKLYLMFSCRRVSSLSIILTFVSYNSALRNSFNTTILVGNQANSRAEVYQIVFNCNGYHCLPKSIDKNDLIWTSPSVGSISEVKRVVYLDQDAILATTGNGAVVFAYPSGSIIFNRQLKGVELGIHSAEVLPDGNVAVIGSSSNSLVILKPSGKPYRFQSPIESVSFPIKYGHGLVYDKYKDQLFALGYLTLLVLKYTSATNLKAESLKLLTSISLDPFYFSPNHNEDFDTEDGGHDLYPIDGTEDLLYLTTGERVFFFNTTDKQISYHPGLSFIWSKHGAPLNLAVRLKGGVKSISRDSINRASIVHAAPWFKELYNEITGEDNNYLAQTSNLIWSLEDGQCNSPDFDYSNNCKVSFSFPEIYFYKARVFQASELSYKFSRNNQFQASTSSSSTPGDTEEKFIPSSRCRRFTPNFLTILSLSTVFKMLYCLH